MIRKTVGKISSDLLQKQADSTDPIEIERVMHDNYEQHIYETIEHGKKDYLKDFFIVVITKKERLMHNVLRNYFVVRETCPTPDYDQTVYHYHRDAEYVEFLWTLPSKDTYNLFKDNVLQIAPEERGLLQFILMDSDGELLALSKKLNGEVKNSNILEKGR